MKPETRAELLDAVGVLWTRYPHWRLGQLLANVAGWADVDIWDAEDEQLLEAIRQQADYQRSRAGAGSAEPDREIT